MKKINLTKLIAIITLFVVLGLSVGYSALQTTLTMSGTALVRGNSSAIYINAVEGPVLLNGATESYTPVYNSKELTISGELPNLDSTISYYVTIYNNSNVVYDYDGLLEEINNNTAVDYETLGLNTGYLIQPHSEATIRLNFMYKDIITTLPANTTFGFKFQFQFFEHDIDVTPTASYISNNLLLNLRGVDKAINHQWIDTLGNVFTINGNVYRNTEDLSYVFDGSDDYVAGSQAFIPATGEFTIEIYLKTQSVPFSATEDQAIISQVLNSNYKNSPGRFKVAVRKEDANNYGFSTFFSNNAAVYGDSPPSQTFYFQQKSLEYNQRYHLQLTRDLSDNRLHYFINGVETNSEPIEADASISQENLKIGAFDSTAPQNFTGSIYAIRIYNDVLSYNELQNNRQADLENYPEVGVTVSNFRLVDRALAYSYTKEGQGIYPDNEGRLIFKGLKPNNYFDVLINTDTNDDGINDQTTTHKFRIISFYPNHTVRLLKVDNPLVKIAWDEANARTAATGDTYCTLGVDSGCNAWNTGDYGASGVVTSNVATINTYLNTTFLNSLNSKFTELFQDGTFKTGAIDLNASYAKVKQQEITNSWTGKVGLPTVADVLEAGLTMSAALDSTGITNNFISTNASSSVNLWTINQTTSNTKDVWLILLPTTISKRMASRVDQGTVKFNAMPVIHLNSRLIVSGTGSEGDPFVLEIYGN